MEVYLNMVTFMEHFSFFFKEACHMLITIVCFFVIFSALLQRVREDKDSVEIQVR